MGRAQVDILCFGAHPDDVEIGMAGTIAKHVQQGHSVVICDLTKAELSSNGSVEEREQEAIQAAQILGVERINLGFPDRGLHVTEERVRTIVQVLRTYQPSVVFLPYEDDRHPDHGQATRLVEEALFNAGIVKYASNEQAAHRVWQVYYYFINGFTKPDLLVDISEHIHTKRAALLAYKSQFTKQEGTVETRLNTGFINVIEGREQLFGKMKQVAYAEGFILKDPILLANCLPHSGKGG